MALDPDVRPSAREALGDEFLKNADDEINEETVRFNWT
jgi:hypothetical protein